MAAAGMNEDAAQTGPSNATTLQATVHSPGTSGHAYEPVLQKLLKLADQELKVTGVPGMSFGLVDAEGFIGCGTLGLADKDRQIPVDPTHLFQIGSITKSFAALCVCRLADEGKIDLDAPLSRYLPEVPLPPEPVSVQQVLSHTAGLPRSTAIVPRVPDGKLWTGFQPGSKWSYSNLGYDLLGKLVEKICEKPFALALRELVIEPLGISISGMREVIQPSDRAQYAVGYTPLDISGPNMLCSPLGQIWMDMDTAAGSIGATILAMTRYVQYLIDVGRGRGAPILSDAAAKRFTTLLEPAATFGNGEGYASGLQVVDLDGRLGLQHTGGTLGYVSIVVADHVTGVGCFVGMNCLIAGYRPTSFARHACALLRHAREGGTVPSPLSTSSTKSLGNAKDYAGVYVGPTGDRVQIRAESDRLLIAADGHEGQMDPVGAVHEGRTDELGSGQFLSDHPNFNSHFFRFERTGDAIETMWFGSALYGRNGPVDQPTVPQEIAPLQGDYVSTDMFTGRWRSVIAQGSTLVVENASLYRCLDIMHKEGDYWRLEGPESACERFRFESEINGVPQSLSISGRDMFRIQRV